MSSDGKGKHDSGLARFLWKLDPIGRFVLPDSISKKPIDSADWLNKQGHAIAKRDPIIQFDRKSGASSWTKETKKISDWAYDHPGDAQLIVGAAVAGGGAAAGAGGGSGAAGGATGSVGGSGAVSTGIGGAIGDALPVVTVTGGAGGGGGTAAAVGGAAAAGGAASSGSSDGGNRWANLAKNFGGQMQQNGKTQEEQAIEMLARQGPPPQALTGGSNIAPVPIDDYQQALTPVSTPQKVFGA